jgi:hypothetical protein
MRALQRDGCCGMLIDDPRRHQFTKILPKRQLTGEAKARIQ